MNKERLVEIKREFENGKLIYIATDGKSWYVGMTEEEAVKQIKGGVFEVIKYLKRNEQLIVLHNEKSSVLSVVGNMREVWDRIELTHASEDFENKCKKESALGCIVALQKKHTAKNETRGNADKYAVEVWDSLRDIYGDGRGDYSIWVKNHESRADDDLQNAKQSFSRIRFNGKAERDEFLNAI